jgi:hypothetical protein
VHAAAIIECGVAEGTTSSDVRSDHEAGMPSAPIRRSRDDPRASPLVRSVRRPATDDHGGNISFRFHELAPSEASTARKTSSACDFETPGCERGQSWTTPAHRCGSAHGAQPVSTCAHLGTDAPSVVNPAGTSIRGSSPG